MTEQIIFSILAGGALRTVWALVSIMTQDTPRGWLYGVTERRIRLMREIKTAALLLTAIILYYFAFPDTTQDTHYDMSSHDSWKLMKIK